MFTNLSDIQKQNYYNLCGERYKNSEIKGVFFTSKPYNNQFYKFSSWSFEFFFHKAKGYLFCALSHSVTHKRFYAWDQKGKEVSPEIISKYFKSSAV